jgi:glycosyltransferase involved in cell wall biosynthesis
MTEPFASPSPTLKSKADMDTDASVMTHCFLRKCGRVYDQLCAHFVTMDKRQATTAELLNWAEAMATLFWVHHPGRFADGKFENVLLRIGTELLDEPAAVGGSVPITVKSGGCGCRRRVLHVVTTAYQTGGHTRLIRNFIKNDFDSHHSLIVTRQAEDEIPEWLSDAVRESGGSVTILPSTADVLSRARSLRSAIRADADVIILHHHPNDLVPVLALSTMPCPPVAVMDHADHVFWVGSTISDLMVEYKSGGKQIAEERRFARKTLMLPLPIDHQPLELSRLEARRRLGIPEDQVVLLSMGSSGKYRPNETHNFFRTSVKILERNPAAHIYLIGLSRDDDEDYVNEVNHDRFHLLGVISDPSAYFVASDLFLNSFPLGGGMAMLESALADCLPILGYGTSDPWTAFHDVAFAGLINSARDEADYISEVCELIADEKKRSRLAAELKERVIEHHAGPTWHASLAAIYRYLADVTHEPHQIPESDYREAGEDLFLAKLRESSGFPSPVIWELGFDQGLTFRNRVRLFQMLLGVDQASSSGRRPMSWVRALIMASRRMNQRIRNSVRYRLGLANN